MVDKQSIIPIYYQLAKFLEKQIRHGEIKPGEALPTEMEIAARFEISRMTVRRAIAELVMAGMVYSQKGKGTFVRMPKLEDAVFELNKSAGDLDHGGIKLKSTLLEARIAKLNEELKNKLQVQDNTTRFLFFRTVCSAKDDRLAYEKKYVVYTKRKPILESELQDPSLSNLVVAHSDSLPVCCKRVVQVSVANEEEATILEISRNAPVFVVEQTIYDLEQKPIGWGKSIYRGDRYKLTTYEGWYDKDLINGGVV